MPALAKLLIAIGLVTTAVGVVLLLAPRLPWLGRLPGDIHVEGRSFSFHFPIITCLVLSVVITILLNVFMKR